MVKRNAAIGMVLFIVYLVLYGGFVFLNAFSAETMESTPLWGINLAVLYGFGLIIAAFILALLYGALCRGSDDAADTNDALSGNEEGQS